MESHNYTSKIIPKIQKVNGEIITGQEDSFELCPV